MGRASMGVKSMRLDDDDIIIDMVPLEQGADVLAITTLGYGKRTNPDEYREQGRNGKGIIATKLTDKTGDLAALLMVKPDEDLMLITDDGTIIRTRAEDIRVCGRNTQGVIVMKLQEGSHVIGVARAERDEEPDVPVNAADADARRSARRRASTRRTRRNRRQCRNCCAVPKRTQAAAIWTWIWAGRTRRIPRRMTRIFNLKYTFSPGGADLPGDFVLIAAEPDLIRSDG